MFRDLTTGVVGGGTVNYYQQQGTIPQSQVLIKCAVLDFSTAWNPRGLLFFWYRQWWENNRGTPSVPSDYQRGTLVCGIRGQWKGWVSRSV